jgi:ankyrin repeat protein
MACALAPLSSRADVTMFPAPEGLGVRTRIAQSACYEVRVNGRPCAVYDSRFGHHVENYVYPHFASFDLNGKALVEITVLNVELMTVVVRPLSQHIQPAIRGQTLTFSIEKSCQLSIEPNGRWDSPLFVFANQPETDAPSDGDAQVIFLGPGIHTEDVVLQNGQTLYLAGGAILTGSVSAEHVQDVTIRGRGIIDFYKPELDKPDGFDEAAQRPGQRPLFCRDVAKAQVNGIIAVNGTRSWTTLSVDCRDLFFENVKIIGGAWWNTDGFAFRHIDGAVVRHCFVMAADDAFCFYSGRSLDNSNITITQCVTFNVAANTVAVAWPGSGVNLHDVRISDMDLIHCSHQDWTWVNYGALRFSNLDQKHTRLENFAMEDIRIEDAHTFCQLIWVGTCRNISFKNIDIHMADRRTASTIAAQWGDITGSIDGVTFQNLRINGKPILSAKDGDIEIGPGVRDVRFLRSTGSSQPPLTLNEAAAIGNLDLVRSLVAKGADVDHKESGFQITPLYRAVESGHREVVEFLLAQGADVSAKCDWRQDTPLHRAATSGGVTQMTELLLAKGADVNATNSYGNTPAHVAVTSGHVAIVELLTARGADLNVKNNDGFAPLHYAVSSRPLSWWETRVGDSSTPNDLAIVQLLLAHGADVNAKTNDGRSSMNILLDENRTEMMGLLLAKGAAVPSIHVAAMMGDVDRVKAFLEDGTDVNTKGKDGQTPLHVAASNKKKDVAELLISRGADVNAKDDRTCMPLFYAVISNDANMVELLVSKRADVHYSPEKGYPPLHFAVWFENKDLVEILVDHGARFDVEDPDGWTAFRYAVSQGNRDIVDLFIAEGADVSSLPLAACEGNLARVKEVVEQGADVNAQDKFGWTPFYWAASLGRTQVAKFLMDKGADVRTAATDGGTTLHQAAQAGDRELVELLLSKGVDVKAKTNQGGTPLHSAASAGHRETAGLLIAKGAEIDAKTFRDQTPLHNAVLGNHKAVVELLIKAGADASMRDRQGRTVLAWAEHRGYKDIADLLRKHGAKE